MEYELIDRPQHVPPKRDEKRQRALFIPEEDRYSEEEELVSTQMEG